MKSAQQSEKSNGSGGVDTSAACPVQGCKWTGPAEAMVSGVCPHHSARFRTEHAAILKHGYDPWKEPAVQKTILERARKAYFDEESRKVMTTDDTTTAQGWFNWFCQKYGVEDMETAQEMVADCANYCGASGAAPLRDEITNRLNLIERMIILFRNYVGNNGSSKLAERCVWLLLGFPALAGADCQAAIVRLELGESYSPREARAAKARVNKCLKFFQSRVPELPPLPNQRDAPARDHMKNAQYKIRRGTETVKTET